MNNILRRIFQNVTFNTNKIKKILNFKPMPLEEGLRKTIN